MGKRSNSKGFNQLLAESTTVNHPNTTKAIRRDIQRVENPVYCGFVVSSDPEENLIWLAEDSFKIFGTMTAKVIETSEDGLRVSVIALFSEAGLSYGDFVTFHDIPLEEIEDRLLEETEGHFGMFEGGYIPLNQDCVYVPVIKRLAARYVSYKTTCNLSPLKEFIQNQERTRLSTHE